MGEQARVLEVSAGRDAQRPVTMSTPISGEARGDGGFGSTGARPTAALASTATSVDDGTIWAWIAVAVLGWVTALALTLFLHRALTKAKLTYKQREWVLVPSTELQRAASLLTRSVESADTAATNAVAASEAVAGAREEFSILRSELQDKSDEVKSLRLGAEFHARKPLLVGLARVKAMIDDDQGADIDPSQTLAGVRVEIDEILESHHVELAAPTVGGSIDQRGNDMGRVGYVATRDAALFGQVASVERPALVYQGPNGEELLAPARVHIYREKEV